jgi:Histidine kinase-, DNA gyrase B-, and HSP90-like ATPase
MMQTYRAAPSASILIESMRDIGYSLETALADIVDNAITAGATKIELFAEGNDNARIGVMDNGTGMNHDELMAAMKLGTRNPLDERLPNDLGRFGLGLKTASFSQCRRLTIVTRKERNTHAAIWDLTYVAKTDDWLVQVPDDIESLPWANSLGSTGTLVIWENLDRLVENQRLEEGLAHFVSRMDDSRRHLELVFHRFLSGELGLPKVEISINSRPLEPLDPFHSRHPATVIGPIENIKIGLNSVTVQTFTLPHHQKVRPDEFDRYAGRDGYLKNQGFYVYREKRLIIYGTWFGLARQAELTKLARVKIDMPNGLDEHWKIDVKKASAQPPFQVRERLRRIIETIGATSKRVFTGRGRRLVADSRLPVWNRIQDKNQIDYQINREHPVVVDYVAKLNDGLGTDFQHVLELAESTLPLDMLFADIGGTPDMISGSTTSDETLQHAVATTVRQLDHAGISLTEIIEMLKVTEPFKSNWNRSQELLAELELGE